MAPTFCVAIVSGLHAPRALYSSFPNPTLLRPPNDTLLRPPNDAPAFALISRARVRACTLNRLRGIVDAPRRTRPVAAPPQKATARTSTAHPIPETPTPQSQLPPPLLLQQPLSSTPPRSPSRLQLRTLPERRGRPGRRRRRRPLPLHRKRWRHRRLRCRLNPSRLPSARSCTQKSSSDEWVRSRGGETSSRNRRRWRWYRHTAVAPAGRPPR